MDVFLRNILSYLFRKSNPRPSVAEVIDRNLAAGRLVWGWEGAL